MEDNAIKAIMIGVGVFVILIILSAIVMYINVAKDVANSVMGSLNSWEDIDYTNILDYSGDITIECKGIDVVNFIRNNVNNENIKISVGRNFQNEDMSQWKNDIGNVSEERIRTINVNATNLKMTKKIVEDFTLVIIEGDIFAIKEKDPNIKYGNIDGDLDIDSDDLQILENYLNIAVLNADGYSKGDINQDGVVDSKDEKLLSDYFVGGVEEIPNGYGDFDNNGIINRKDILFIEKYVRGYFDTEAAKEAADINRDRVIDWKDYEQLEYKIVNGIEE